MLDRILLNTAGISAVLLTGKPVPGNWRGILQRSVTNVSRLGLYVYVFKLHAHQVASAPSPIQIKAIFTFGCRDMALFSESEEMLYRPKLASVIAMTNHSSEEESASV